MSRLTVAARGPLGMHAATRGHSRRAPATTLSVLASIFTVPYRALTTFRLWQARSAYRTRLMSLDDHMLADIGLNRSEVAREIQKPFWVE